VTNATGRRGHRYGKRPTEFDLARLQTGAAKNCLN
jgi:hypothetical protein